MKTERIGRNDVRFLRRGVWEGHVSCDDVLDKPFTSPARQGCQSGAQEGRVGDAADVGTTAPGRNCRPIKTNGAVPGP